MTIVPEDKDWTWVLREPCPECGIDAGRIEPAEVAGLARRCARDWLEVLGADGDLRARPAPDRWSTLEYGCHVRDVFRTANGRLALLLEQDDPEFANWDQDATAVADRYAEQDPEVVAAELVTAADLFADALDGVEGAQWDHPGRRSDGARFTVATFAQYLIHDPLHHLVDVRGGAVG